MHGKESKTPTKVYEVLLYLQLLSSTHVRHQVATSGQAESLGSIKGGRLRVECVGDAVVVLEGPDTLGCRCNSRQTGVLVLGACRSTCAL